jgi:hypothetical protein
MYPADSSIHVVTKGPYFVINEFAKASVAKQTRATISFEPLKPNRNTKDVMGILQRGGYLADAGMHEMTNQNGVKIQIVENVQGIDPEVHYDWAFIDHPNGKVFLSVLLFNLSDDSVYKYILDNLEAV